MNHMSALPTCSPFSPIAPHQEPPFSSTGSYRLAPSKVSSGLSKLDVVKKSELELLMYVMSIIKFIKTLLLSSKD